MKDLKLHALVTFIVLCAAVMIFGGTINTGKGTTASQDQFSLDRRITTLETRMFSLESQIRQIEQQMSMTMRTPSVTRQNDSVIETLQSQISLLQSQLNEMKCGLAKLDERTLPAARRPGTGQSDRRSDPCRLDPNTPLVLSH
jgi:TolA-binding protein